MFKPEYILIGLALLVVLAVVQYQSMSSDRLWSADQSIFRDRPKPVENCDVQAPGENDYRVYQELLPKEETNGDSLYSTILITDTVLYPHGAEAVGNLVGQEWPGSVAARKSFTSSSSKKTALDRDEFQQFSLVLATEAEIERVFANGDYQGWMALGNASIIRFSRIGFNCERDQAIVYKSLSCGSLCGVDELFLLEKKAGQWAILNQLALTTS